MTLNLTKGFVSVVDDDIDDSISNRKYQATQGIRNNTPYATTTINKKTFFLHRMIMNPPEGMVVDHINGDTLDNRKENLRICTQFENMRNRKVNINNKYGFKGVHYQKSGRKYRARISVDGKRISLGMYKTLEEARDAYSEASVRYHKEFRRLK